MILRPSAGVVSRPAELSGKPKAPPRLLQIETSSPNPSPLRFFCSIPYTPSYLVLSFPDLIVGEFYSRIGLLMKA